MTTVERITYNWVKKEVSDIKNKRFLTLAMVFILAMFTMLGCAANKNVQKVNDKGFMWEIEKDGAKAYLFGSIHIGNEDMFPMSELAEEAFEASDNLVVEINLNNINMFSVMNRMSYPNGDDVYKHLTEEGKMKLDQTLENYSIDPNFVKKYKLWVIEQMIMDFEYKKLGYSSEYAVDKYFTDKAEEAEKEILELESMELQLDLFDNMYSNDEKSSLEDLNVEEAAQQTEDMYNAYQNADEDVLRELVIDSFKNEYPEQYDIMFTKRNIGMADKIEGYLNSQGTYFVVAGAGHYIGEDSVVKILEERGYTVKNLNEKQEESN